MFSKGSNVTLQGHEEIVEYLVIIMPYYTMLKVPVYTHNKAPQHEPISLVLTLPNLGDTLEWLVVYRWAAIFTEGCFNVGQKQSP